MEQQKLTLKEWREKRGLTQFQLSVKSGVSISAIANTENGRHMPTIDNAEKLVKALEITLNDVKWSRDNS